MNLDHEELQLLLEAISLKLYNLRHNSWASNAPVKREDMIAVYEDLKTRIMNECGKDS